MQFPAFSRLELVNPEGIMLTKNEILWFANYNKLLVFSCSFFTLLINVKKISHFFHTSKINYYFVCEPQMLHVKQPDIIMSGVRLETKPPSVHVLTVHLHNVQKKMMFLKSQRRLVVQFHENYSTNTTWFMSVKRIREF